MRVVFLVSLSEDKEAVEADFAHCMLPKFFSAGRSIYGRSKTRDGCLRFFVADAVSLPAAGEIRRNGSLVG